MADTSPKVLSTIFRVGHYRCEMSLPTDYRPDSNTIIPLKVEWSPNIPTKMSLGETAMYRFGRDNFIAEFSKITGLKLAVAEI